MCTHIRHYNGNDQGEEWQVRGFGHVGYLVDDLDAACAALEASGVAFKKKPAEGNMRGESCSGGSYYTVICV